MPLAGRAQASPPTGAADSAALAARAFYDAIGVRRWATTANLVHSERLRVVRSNLRMMVDADPAGVVLSELLDFPDRAAFDRATDEEVFERVLRTLERRIEPLARVLSTNEVRIVGAVPEGNEAHVVVRVTPYADGPRPSWVRVLTVRRDGPRWRVFDSDEITSITTAVLGLPLHR
jgi:hypothetical protein